MKIAIEIIGYVAAVLIVLSMVFKTTTYKGTMLMRIINALGSIAFIIFGFYELQAVPTGVTNAAGFLLNIFYIIKEYRDHKKEKLYK